MFDLSSPQEGRLSIQTSWVWIGDSGPFALNEHCQAEQKQGGNNETDEVTKSPKERFFP